MTWKSYFTSPSPFQICHFKHTRFNFLIGLNFSFRLSRGAPQQARGGEQSPAAPHPAIQPGPHNPPGPGAAGISLAKRHTGKKKKKIPRRPFPDLLFLVSRGAVAARKGLNRRARIFEFVTVFNSQKSQTNTGLIRQPAIAPAHHQQPTESRYSAEGDQRGAHGAGLRGRHGHPRVGGSSRVRRVTRAAPARELPPGEGRGSVFIIHPLRTREGGKGDAVALEECAKWGEKKKAAGERIASKQLRAAAPLSCLVFYLNTPSFSRKKTLHNSARSAPRFAAGNGQRAAPTPRHPDPRSGEGGTNHPEKPPGLAGTGGTAGKTESTSLRLHRKRRKKKRRKSETHRDRTHGAATTPAGNTAISSPRLTAKPPAPRLENTSPAEERGSGRGREVPEGGGSPGYSSCS